MNPYNLPAEQIERIQSIAWLTVANQPPSARLKAIKEQVIALCVALEVPTV